MKSGTSLNFGSGVAIEVVIGIALDNVAAEIGMGLAWGTALGRAAKKPDQRDRNPDRRCLHMLADLPLDLSSVSERHWGLCLVQKRDDTGRVTVPQP